MSEHADPGRERGITMVELLVTIVILGTAFVAILGTVSGRFSADALQQQATINDVLFRRYSEALHTRSYVPCARPADYRPALIPAPPSGVIAEIRTVEYWDGMASGSFGGSVAACQSASDKGVQRVTLRIRRNSTQGLSETVVLYKRATA